MVSGNKDVIMGNILKALRSNSKGLTVTEISKEIDLNRNSTAKYLDVLRVNGQIDMKPTGRAKLYFISQRVPISALLDFSTDLILVLDGSMRIVDVNDNFQRTFKVKKEMLLDVDLRSSNLPLFNTRESRRKIKAALRGKDSTFDMKINFSSGPRFFKGRLIPSTLGDGNTGVTVIMENVTQNKLAEEKLKLSEERYRELIENQGEGLGITDLNDIFTFANPAAEKIMGVGEGGLKGRSIIDFVPQNERKKIRLQSERRKKGKKDTYQISIISRDGKKKSILLTATPRYDHDGKYIGSLGVFRDITVMKENQRKVTESEERYRSLFESSSDGILILKDRTIIECNQSAVRLFGFGSKDGLIGKDPAMLSPELQDDGTPSVQAVRDRMRESNLKGFVNFQWKHRTRQGRIFLADVRLQRVDLEGETVHQATLRDITDMVRTRNELVEKQARLDNILSSLHGSFIGLINRDMAFREFWGTEELDRKYGIRSSRLIGMSILDFTAEDKRSELEERLMRTFNEGIPFRVEHRAVLPSGRFWQEWSFSPFRNEQGDIEYVVQFGRDTQEKNTMVEALMKVGKRYELLDTHVSDVIWMADDEMRYTYISSSVKDLIGLRPEEIVGREIFHFFADDPDLDSIKNRILQGMGSGRENKGECPAPVTIEHELVTDEGKRIWCEISISFLVSSDNRPRGMVGVTRNIHERKMAETEVRDKEERLNIILSSLYNSFIGLIGKDHLYHDFWGSTELDSDYGMDSGKIKGKNALDFASPGKREEFGKLIDSVFETGKAVQIEVSTELSGREIWTMLSLTPFRDRTGDVKYVIQFGIDTTEKQIASRSLRDIQKKYQLLDRNVKDMIWMTDTNLNFTYISSSSKVLIGYDPKELMGKHFRSVLDEDSVMVLEREFGKEMGSINRNDLSKKGSISTELLLKRKNGDRIWTDVNIALLTDEGSDPIGLTGISRDITERKRYQKELVRLSSAMKLASEAIIIFDLDNNITDVNESGMQLLGLGSMREASGMNGLDLLMPDDRYAASNVIAEVFEKGRSGEIEHVLKTPGGKQLIVETSANRLDDPDGEPIGFVTITKDITERSRNLREIELKDRILEAITSMASFMLQKGSWKSKIGNCLERLGKATDVSRVYIFKNREDEELGTLTTQIFEWSHEGIKPQEDNPELQNFPLREGFQRWERILSGGDSLFGNIESFPLAERGMLKEQGIISIAVVPIHIEGRWWGFIGFDECNDQREWFKEEIGALKMAGSMLGAVIMGHEMDLPR